jgi:prepilin-type N-terminal cleavage/methylation domain-containing protein
MNVRSNGFSLIELVITIVVMAILAAFVLSPSVNSMGQHSVNTHADEFRRNLSHIQIMAISQSQRLRLQINAAGNNYTVIACNNAACTTPVAVIDPATGLNFSVNLSNNVTFAAANRNTNLDFDSLGRPQVGGVLIAAMRTFTLSGSGSNVPVNILPITGFAS